MMDRFKVAVGLDREGSFCSPAETTTTLSGNLLSKIPLN
jgi:hypothetical protein